MAEHFEYINLKDKKLRGRPVLEWMLYYEPTERIMLWIISNYKEAFNPKHFLQYAKSNNPQDPNDHKLKKNLEMLQALKGRGFIKQDKDLNYHVTLSGQLHRLTTHPQWLLVPGIALLAVITFGVLNYTKNNQSGHKSEESDSLNPKPFDSSQLQASQIPTLKDSGSSLTVTDTTKRKDSTTKRR